MNKYSLRTMNDKVTTEKYSEILELQKKLNTRLQDAYEANKNKGREHLAEFLVNFVEGLVDGLNAKGYNFGRCDYSGDVNFENSEQTYSDGNEMGTGVILHFHGFSLQASWEG